SERSLDWPRIQIFMMTLQKVVLLRLLPLKLRDAEVLLPSQDAIQPRLGDLPIALDAYRCDSQDLGRFLDAQTTEVAQLHDAGLAGVDPGQGIERLMQGQ